MVKNVTGPVLLGLTFHVMPSNRVNKVKINIR